MNLRNRRNLFLIGLIVLVLIGSGIFIWRQHTNDHSTTAVMILTPLQFNFLVAKGRIEVLYSDTTSQARPLCLRRELRSNKIFTAIIAFDTGDARKLIRVLYEDLDYWPNITEIGRLSDEGIVWAPLRR